MDLTKGNIKKLIMSISIPASMGFFFNTLFNITDTYFTSYIGVNALAGLSLSFPVFFILISLGSGIGMGVSALISNSIGEQDKEKAFEIATDSVSLTIVIGIIITIVGLYFNKDLFELMGAQGEALYYGLKYTKWTFLGAVFFCINMVFNGILVAQGNTSTYRNFLIVGFFLNVILDPFFIFVLNTTTDGVAIATVIVQIIGNVYLYFKVKNSALISGRNYHLKVPKLKNVLAILNQGLPASFNMMTMAIGIFVINHYIQRVAGENAIASYGIATRIEQLALLPAIGLNSAALSITGQNFGAKNFVRVKEVFYKTLTYGLIIMTVAMFLILPVAPFLFGIFTEDPSVIEYGIGYFRVEIFTFNSYIFLNISDAVLRGLKYPKFSILIGIYRQFLMPMLLFPIFIEKLNGVLGIWIGIMIINWSAAFIAIIYLRYVYNKISKKI
ncbi:MATE family efflux transporter [uncultured Cetobacterium sp.]|uniref:MATE family efflux transporter n=1 Tax=uncultured Cetobacterium sp. TaxID=527638 RepID=UPI002638C732|nr:MATE family efflux transporter [uncultured Cetobacterium sp.]